MVNFKTRKQAYSNITNGMKISCFFSHPFSRIIFFLAIHKAFFVNLFSVGAITSKMSLPVNHKRLDEIPGPFFFICCSKSFDKKIYYIKSKPRMHVFFLHASGIKQKLSTTIHPKIRRIFFIILLFFIILSSL